MTKILAFAGSLREQSFNHRLLLAAASLDFAGADSTEITVIRLRDFDIPMFDEDLEKAEGIPANVRKLKALFKAHDGLLLACPEYNSSITAALKNAIDWASRPMEGEGRLECFNGKVAGLLAASPGRLGGLRGLREVRSILSSIGTLVVPQEFALASAHEAFADDGSLRDEGNQKQVRSVLESMVRVASAVGGSR